MIIEIEGKGGSLVKTFNSVNGTTPRVGDVLASSQYSALLNGITTVMVVEVIHEHIGDELIARVRCRPTGDNECGDRLMSLEDNGWLYPRD